MKKISVMIPCYNEEENVVPMSKEIVSRCETKGHFLEAEDVINRIRSA